MTIRLGVIMDPIRSIHYKKDSTLAMLWEASERGFEIFYFEQPDLFLRDGVLYGNARRLDVFHDPVKWYSLQESHCLALTTLNVILMRKDPPFNEEFVYTTQLLDHVEKNGTLIINRPSSLRDFNEKLFVTYFPQEAPPTLVTRSIAQLTAFWHEHHDIVCKPLDSMGGTSVFRIRKNEINAPVIFETLTAQGSRYMMAQLYVPDIKKTGDKRILMIHGEPISHALARIPQGDDWRGNLAVGAQGTAVPLTARDREICEAVKPMLLKNGLYFAGLDVIGDYLTEINITSPTGIRELDTQLNINISATLFDVIMQQLG